VGGSLYRGDDFGEERPEGFGRVDGFLLEGEEFGEFEGGANEGPGEFAVVNFLRGGHEGVEVEREVFESGVGDDADGGAGDVAFAAVLADAFAFHLDSIGTHAAPEALFFFGCDGNAARAEKTDGGGAGLFERVVKGAAFVRAEDDFVGFEDGVQSARETAGEDEAASSALSRPMPVM
jgi:hypothetical protein